MDSSEFIQNQMQNVEFDRYQCQYISIEHNMRRLKPEQMLSLYIDSYEYDVKERDILMKENATFRRKECRTLPFQNKQ